jgi:hypothetical protein
VTISQQVKTYNEEVPLYLHNRPKDFVLHCLKRIANAEEISEIPQEKECGQFSVNGHVTTLGNDREMPSCDCSDWKNSHLPCKHMWKIMNTIGKWDSLSVLLRESPFLTVDAQCIESGLIDNRTHEVNTPFSGQQVTMMVNDDCPSASDVAVDCREILQEIATCTYSDLSLTNLQELRQSLQSALETLRKAMPTQHGLSLLSSRKRRCGRSRYSNARDTEDGKLHPRKEFLMPKKLFRGLVDNIERSLVNGDNEVIKMPSELQGERERQNNGGACCASEPSSYNEQQKKNAFCQFTLLHIYTEYV